MPEAESEFLTDLRAHARETRTFLSNRMKSACERSVCRAFLRALGVSFADSELVAPNPEPIDVYFRDLRFQVLEVLRGRNRGDVWKSKEQQYGAAESVADLLEPYSPPTAISYQSLVPEVAEALSEKAKRYGIAGCKALDALVYVDLEDGFLDIDSPMPESVGLERDGWRSVSVLFSSYAVVLRAGENSDALLREAVGVAHSKWPDAETLFDIAA